MLLAVVMTFSGLITLFPLEAEAASQYITGINVTADTTRTVSVSFHYSKDTSDEDVQSLFVALYNADLRYITYHDFGLDNHDDPRGDYYCVFNGLSPDTQYNIRIHGHAFTSGVFENTERDYYSDYVPVTTLAPEKPVIGLSRRLVTHNSVWLKAQLTSTGTGWSYDPDESTRTQSGLAGELLANELIIVPKAMEPEGNLEADTPGAVVAVQKIWDNYDNVFDRYVEYTGLAPGTQYVAQAILSNVHSFIAYSPKITFTTLTLPQISVDEIKVFSDRAYVYATVELGAGDALEGIALFADDSDAQQPKDDPARISGSLVNYDSGARTAVFHLSGLTVNTTYDVQVLTRSGAGETWSQRGTFTTLPAPTAATVETQAATSIRNTKALMNATITDMGYSFVLAQGFVYSSGNTNPRRGDADAVEVTVPITSQTAPSTIAALADGLTPNTTYYFQSFVRNNVGTVYGGVLTFTTQDAPEVDTLSSTSDLTTSTVTLYGEVISTGGLSPTLRGFVFSETANPVLGEDGVRIALDSVTDASVGQFDETLSDLSSGTTYYYKAFIHSVQGTTYGTEQDFTTESMATILPAVTTSPIETASITDDSAPVSGSFTTPEDTVVTETGFVYSKFPNPTMGDINTAFIPLTDTDGSFEATLTGLSSGTTYYMRAYAENENGIGYGGGVSFTTRTSGEMTIYPPAVISSLTVDSITANTVTVTMITSGAAALGRKIYYSSTDTTPAEGEAGVSSVSYSLGESGQKTIADLQPNTTYYLRGHTNAIGGTEYYGGVLTVTTDEYGLPIVALGEPAVDMITDSGAKIHYQINPNGIPITKTAVVWSKDITVPALGADGIETDEEDLFCEATIITSHSLTGLTSDTTYYYAVYAYNAEGWSCSDVGSFTTLAGDTPVVTVIDVDSSADRAFINAQMTQDGTGSNKSYSMGVLVSKVDDATFATPGILVYRAPDVSTTPFAADFTGLSPSTQYYARAFACSIDDVYYYGAVVPFTTQAPPLASVALYGPENISATAADFLISVLDGGGNPIDARGLVYGETALPDLGDTVIVSTGAGTTPGQTSAQLAGLTTGTKYYVRAYATTANGTAYSDQIMLTPRENILPPTTGNYMISVGFHHNVALRADGTVWCWGRGTEGQLGNGGVANSLTPVQVSGLTDVKCVAAGYDCSFAVKNDGTVWAWGYNKNGELGLGTTANSSVPVQISSLSDVSMVSASYGLVNGTERAGFALVLVDHDTVYAWGANNNKQVENSASPSVSTPVQVPGLSDITQIYAGHSAGMALKDGGSVWVWGCDWTMSGGGNAVRQITALGTDNVKITASNNLLSLKSDGTVWSFGDNRYGQCGHDIGTNFVAPAAMTGVTGVADIESGNFLTVLRKTDGSVWSVGLNLNGEFGSGTAFAGPEEEPYSTTLTESLIKSNIPAGTNIVQTSVDLSTVAQVLDDGSIWMYGSNVYDNIGNGVTGTTHTPYMLPTINLLTGVSAMYTVTFDPNGGTCSTLTATTDTAGRLSSLPTAARSGYRFDGWYSAATGGTSITTSTAFSADTTVFAHWILSGGTSESGGGTSGSGGGTGGGGGGGIPAPPANLRIDSGGVVSVHPELDTATGKARVAIDNNTLNTALGRITGNSAGTRTVGIDVRPTKGAAGFEVSLPSKVLSGEASTRFRISTDVATVTLPGNMLTQGGNGASELAALSITRLDASKIANEKTRQLIGDRPVIQLTLTLDGEKTDWNNPKAPVTVTIPYAPTAAELANPESIVIWYIDGSGNAISVPNGYYDPATGTVTFTTTHFSDFAVSYNKVSFNDVGAGAWYSKAVHFIAARDITNGTGDGMYSPDAKLTRGEFIVLLMRAYGIAPDTNITDNFADAGNTYFTNYLAAAKRLGISAGVGGNMYAPGKEITRQEMFTLLYNALKVIDQLPQDNSGKTLSSFTDAGQINSWAKEAMTLLVETGTVGGYDGKLHPIGTTTRAEMAQVLYNLLGK